MPFSSLFASRGRFVSLLLFAFTAALGTSADCAMLPLLLGLRCYARSALLRRAWLPAVYSYARGYSGLPHQITAYVRGAAAMVARYSSLSRPLPAIPRFH